MTTRPRIVWLLLVLALALAAALPAQDLLPELQPLAAKHKADLTSLDNQEATAVTRATAPYLAALDTLEKSATAQGNLALVAAIGKEREAAKTGSFPAESANRFYKEAEARRQACLAVIAQISKDFSARQQRVDAEYLRALASMQSRAPANSELARQLAAEKDSLLQGATAYDAKKLRNTQWSWHFAGRASNDQITFSPAGVGKHTNSAFKWEAATAPRTFTLTLTDGRRATIQFNEAFSGYKGTDFDGKTAVAGERK